jgi:Sec-independent protein translocase protein TatA
MLASWGEIAVVLGAGALLYGPKDLPRVARAAGRMVGGTVAFLKKVRPPAPAASSRQLTAG